MARLESLAAGGCGSDHTLVKDVSWKHLCGIHEQPSNACLTGGWWVGGEDGLEAWYSADVVIRGSVTDSNEFQLARVSLVRAGNPFVRIRPIRTHCECDGI